MYVLCSGYAIESGGPEGNALPAGTGTRRKGWRGGKLENPRGVGFPGFPETCQTRLYL